MKFFSSPQFISSYRGEADYSVGIKASKGTPSVTCRFFLYQSELLALNCPEVFWKYLIHEIGTIRWRFNPESILNSQEFVPSEVSDMFQGYAPGRFTDSYQSYEVLDDWPNLVATAYSFEPLVIKNSEKEDCPDLKSSTAVIWTGKASEMTTEKWFELIFPNLYPPLRANIYKALVRKEIPMPNLEISDEPYVHCNSNQNYEIRLARLKEATLYWDSSTWEKGSPTRYYSHEEAMCVLQNLK